MTKVTADPELRAKLGNLQDLVEVCDENGRIVGFFHPVAPSDLPQGDQINSPISVEEIELARLQKTGRPLTDILGDLDREG